MTVHTEMTVQVPIPALRAALVAVVPHADRQKLGDDEQILARVRIAAVKGELHVFSTDSRTTALAAVPFVEGTDSRADVFTADDGPLVVDLAPVKARRIAREIKVAKGDDLGPQIAHLEIDTAAGAIVVTDVSGLWPGDAVKVGTLDLNTEFPDVVAIIAKAAAGLKESPGAKSLEVDAAVLKAFAAAGDAYGAKPDFVPTGTADSRGWVVRIGSTFVGTASSSSNDGDSLKRKDRDWHAHLVRLGVAGALASVG